MKERQHTHPQLKVKDFKAQEAGGVSKPRAEPRSQVGRCWRCSGCGVAGVDARVWIKPTLRGPSVSESYLHPTPTSVSPTQHGHQEDLRELSACLGPGRRVADVGFQLAPQVGTKRRPRLTRETHLRRLRRMAATRASHQAAHCDFASVQPCHLYFFSFSLSLFFFLLFVEVSWVSEMPSATIKNKG